MNTINKSSPSDLTFYIHVLGGFIDKFTFWRCCLPFAFYNNLDMSFRDVGRSHLTSRNRVAPAPLSVSNSANRELSPSPPPEKVVSTPTRRRSDHEARQQPEPCPASPIDQIAAALQLHDRERSYRSERKLIQQSTTVPRYDIAKSLRMSAFSRLNDEIVQFQKLVNDLQEIVDTDVLTPEDQWR